MKKTDKGIISYFLRSSVFGGQVIAELNSSGTWIKGYVYDGGGNFLAFQKDDTVYWVHQDPITKSKRLTDTAGNVISTVEVTPFGDDTGSFSNNRWVQRRMYTTYERDGNASDEAHHRRYNRYYGRFDQPDPFDGSYDLSNPQSLNRYSYTQNDPVNFVDPSGLNMAGPNTRYGPCPPGSVRCSDEFAAGYPFLPGFNHFGWIETVGDHPGVEYIYHSATVHSFSYGYWFGGDDQEWDAAKIVAQGVEAALQVLANGCWDSTWWDNNVKPGDRHFANISNPEKYTANWKASRSKHAKGVKESPSVGRVRLDARSFADNYAAVVVNFDFVVKYYPGQGMAVTANTDSLKHHSAAFSFYTGLSKDINKNFAEHFLEIAPKCPDKTRPRR